MYTDANGDTICWFMPLGDTIKQYINAKTTCNAEANAYLIELDTLAKHNLFISSELYDSIE